MKRLIASPSTGALMALVASALIALAVAVPAFGSVSTAAAATPKLYWSEERAEAMALLKVRIPFCHVFADQDFDHCRDGVYRPDGRPVNGTFHVTGVACTGADEKGETFTYARFKCRFVTGLSDRDYATGRLVLYPAGAAKIRWKLTSIAST